jgi:DNA-binding PadR family transcriptional regulator
MPISTLGYALLGLLARRPRTGYDLTQALREPIGYFWTATHSQVYPELTRLEQGGHVRHRIVDNPGPRDGKLYRITAAGRRALAEWSVTDVQSEVNRDEFLLKIYSTWTADPAATRDAITRHRGEHRDRLAHYEAIEDEFATSPGGLPTSPTDPDFSSYATLRRGLSFERHAIDWCGWLLTALAQSS